MRTPPCYAHTVRNPGNPARRSQKLVLLRALGKSGPGFVWSYKTTVMLCLFFLATTWPQVGFGLPPALEVTSLGLSRKGDTTFLTVMANRVVTARVTPQHSDGQHRLLVEFPTARPGRLPAQLAGDEVLVKRVLTDTTTSQGVKIILELVPARPYNYWRTGKIMPNGQYAFVVGLQSETITRPQETAPPAKTKITDPERVTNNYATPPPSLAASARPGTTGGSLAELKNLIPKAIPLLQFLESDGWNVERQEDYDRPGKRFSRGFFLSNTKHPEMIIKIAYLPANAPGAPNIAMVTLSMENISGDTAAEYRQLRQWSFSQIKSKYEDIGDFFEDALKPLRVKLRQQCQEVARREEAFLRNFASQAFPDNPQATDQLLKHIKEKINPRFEGVQYTISEDPVGVLNLVDFLFVRAYYLDHHQGGGYG